MIEKEEIKRILEGALFAADEPLSLANLKALFSEEEHAYLNQLPEYLGELMCEYEERGVVLKKLASGYCFQVRENLSQWILRLWETKPPRYSRALLETLAIIAYRQPITRAEIEAIRGVAVSTHIIKTITEREWVKVVGHRDVPGKPSLYGTTKTFLDYFNLASLAELPSLLELKETDPEQLELPVEEAEKSADLGEELHEETEVEEAITEEDIENSLYSDAEEIV